MDHTSTGTAAARSRRERATGLVVDLRLRPDGPVVACEPVRDADLAEVRAEAWFELLLRRGETHTPLDGLGLTVVPLRAETGSSGGGEVLGFALELARSGAADARIAARGSLAPGTTDPRTEPPHAVFGRDCMEPVAARAARALRSSGVLPTGSTPYYSLRILPTGQDSETSGSASVASGGNILLDVVETPPSLAVLRVPLAPLLARAERVDLEEHDPRHPVFYTRAALAKAERVARKGARASPPVETGGMLTGPLCSDPESGEFFAVVTDVIDGSGAERAPYSLTFTGETWARVERVMRARRSQPGQQALRLLGSTHGHNFVPLDGEPPCSRCRPGACTRTSAFFSTDDEAWTRAVFAQQPWALGHVFGLNALREPVHALFGTRGGRIQRRGFHVIDAFTPA